MDAISFVLGAQSKTLRSSAMKELIHRAPGKAPSSINSLSVSVTLVYIKTSKTSDKDSNMSSSSSDGDEIRFTRTISKGGKAYHYQVDGTTIPFAAYETRLSEIGILLRARNFLVFQGDVEGIARKTPAQLVQMVEEISGSSSLKAEYDLALKERNEADSNTLSALTKHKGARNERRAYKEQKEEAEGNIIYHTNLNDCAARTLLYSCALFF